MATLVFDTDFEPPTTLAALFPSGIVSNTAYTTTYVRTGTQAMYCNGDPCYQQHILPAPFPAAVYVARFYIWFQGFPSGSIEIFNVLPNAGGGLRLGLDGATKKLGWLQGSGVTYSFLSASAVSLSTWYRIDMRVTVSGTTFTADWQINGVAQTQASWTGNTGTTISSIFFGHPTGNTGWPSISFDSYSVSGTSADYPLGAPAPPATVVVVPPAIFTAASVAPAVSGTALVVAPPAVETFASVAPSVSGTALVVSPAANFNASAVAPTPSVDETNVAPPATITFPVLSPTLFIGTSNTVVAPPATFNASSVAPAPRVDETNIAPPAVATFSSVAPAVSGTALVVAPPAQFTAQSVAPAVSGTALVVATPMRTTFATVAPGLAETYVAPPATWTASSVAPGVIAAQGVVSPAAVATMSAVAPAVSGTALVVAPPATATYVSVAPLLTLSKLITPPPTNVTYSAVAPQVQISLVVTSPPATWTASGVGPGLGMTVYGVPGIWTASSVAPGIARDWTITSPPGLWTASAPAPGIQSGASNTVAVPFAAFTASSVAPIIGVSSTVVVTQFTLITSGNEITDATRQAGVQGDGRPVESSFGLWEATTNMILNGGFETGTGSGWQKYNLTAGVNPISLGTDGGIFGANYLKCICDTVGNFGMKCVDFKTGAPLSQGPYTWSLWARAGNAQTVGKGITFQVNEQGGATGDGSIGPVSPPLQATWQRYSGTGTFAQADRTHMSLFAYAAGTAGQAGSAIGDEVHIDGVQVEQLSIRTPYIETTNAAKARADARIQAPSSALNPTQGWVAARMRVGRAVSTGSSGPGVFFLSDGVSSGILGFESIGTGFSIYERIGAAGPYSQANQGPVSAIALGALTTVVFAWDAGFMRVSVNGAAFASTARTHGVPTGITNFDIGSLLPWLGNTRCDADFFWFACGTGIPTTADLATLNALGNTDPTIAQLPGGPTLLWTADTVNLELPSVLVLSSVAPVVSIIVVAPAAQLNMAPANPSLTVAAPPVPVPVTYSSTSPTLFIGTSSTVVAPAAQVTQGATAPTLGVTTKPPAGNFTTSSNAPGLSLAIQPSAALINLAPFAPIIGLGGGIVAPPAKTTFAVTAPSIARDNDVGAPAASWIASAISPALSMQLVASTQSVAFSAVVPIFGQFAYVYAIPIRATFVGGLSSVSIEGSGMVYTYTPGAVWQAPDGDVAAPKTGRIVQSYERP